MVMRVEGIGNNFARMFHLASQNYPLLVSNKSVSNSIDFIRLAYTPQVEEKEYEMFL